METTKNSMVCSDCGGVAVDAVLYEQSGICRRCFELDVEIMYMEQSMAQLDRAIQAARGVIDDLRALLNRLPTTYSACPF